MNELVHEKVKANTPTTIAADYATTLYDEKQEQHKQHDNYNDNSALFMIEEDNSSSSYYTHTPSSSNEYDELKGPSDDELRRLTRKRDFRILPLVSLFYLFSFIDRVNIGNAKLAGLIEDTNMTDSEFNGALSIFFAGYIFFEVPANMVLNRVGPKIWMAVLLGAWGVVMASMAGVKNGTQLMVARFFLGVAEAGLVPAILYYMSIWYTKQEQARRIAAFFAASTCAGAFGGALAYALMHMAGLAGLNGWQWIFLIEAIPPLLLSIVSYLALPDLPEVTPFLTERERKVFITMMAADVGPISEIDTKFSWPQFYAVFKDWKTYAYSMIAMCIIVCIYSISMFLPSIVHGMGFTALEAQAVSTPPYILACIFTALNGVSADKRQERGLHVTVPLLLSTLGYILLITLKDKGVAGLYIATMFVTTGMFAAYAPVAAWFTNNIAGRTKRSVAVAAITSIGNIGGIIAGQLYRADDAPHYVHGHGAALGFMATAVIIALCLKIIFIRINKRRENMTSKERRVIIEGNNELCDKHPDFRYIS